MTKYFKLVLAIVIFIILGYSLYTFTERLKFNDSTFAEAVINENSGTGNIQDGENGSIVSANNQNPEEEIPNETIATSKYDVLKNNQLYKKSIDAGDSFFVENKLISALKNYQSAQKLVPADGDLQVKIGDVHYELKNYELAYNHYKGKDNIEGFSKRKEVLSLFFANYEFGDKEIETLKQELQDIVLTEQERIYYFNILQCVVDFSNCKLFFKDYFYADESPEIELELLQRIKDGLEAYDSSSTDDLNYKNALVIGKLFENRDYAVVLKLGNDLLEEFPDYESVIQMVSKSYYELGLYDEAHNILKPLHERKLNDAKISYFMGVINIRRKLFLSSSIYFNKALDSGFEPIIDAKRKLVYNYFLIDNKEKMYLRLNDLLYENDVQESDFALGIYQALQDKKYDFALDYAKRGIVNFPETARFYGYVADIHIRMGNNEQAQLAIETGERLDPKEPSLIYYEGKIALAEKNYSKAFITFKRVISLSGGEGEFIESAKAQLDVIANARAKEKKEAEAEKKRQAELQQQS